MDVPLGEGAVIAMGKLRPGYHKVAAVVWDDVYEAILRLKADRGLPSAHAATGAALVQWYEDHRRRVQNPDEPLAKDGPKDPRPTVQNPGDEHRQEVP